MNFTLKLFVVIGPELYPQSFIGNGTCHTIITYSLIQHNILTAFCGCPATSLQPYHTLLRDLKVGVVNVAYASQISTCTMFILIIGH